MDGFFRIITPITYWILVIIWLYIFIFYLRKIKSKSLANKLLKLLLFILAIDAFRSLLESLYFGAWYTSLSGLIPIEIFNYLAQPQIVFFPKIINLIAAILILVLIINRWLPSEIIQNKQLNVLVEKQISELSKTNKELNKAKIIAEESEEKFRTLITSMNDLVFVFDESKRLLYYHSPKSDMFLVNPKDLLGKTISEVMPASINELFDKAFSVVKKGKAHGFEYFLEIQGEIEWYSMQLSPMYKDDKFSGVIAVARNVTEKKKTENGMLESKYKMEAALSSMSDAVFISDKNATFTHMNNAFATFHKFKDLEECSKKFKEYPNVLDVLTLDGEIVPSEKWAVPRALSGEIGKNIEFVLLRKDSGESWIGSYNFAPIFNDNKEIIGSVVTARDITERKKTEEDLKKHRDKLEELVKERTVELQNTLQEVQRMNELFVGREFRIKELKDEVEQLKQDKNPPTWMAGEK